MLEQQHSITQRRPDAGGLAFVQTRPILVVRIESDLAVVDFGRPDTRSRQLLVAANFVRHVRNPSRAGNQNGEPFGSPLCVAELRGQWLQPPGLPSESDVRKLLPQPQADTAFGLLTVKPAPISVSR